MGSGSFSVMLSMVSVNWRVWTQLAWFLTSSLLGYEKGGFESSQVS